MHAFRTRVLLIDDSPTSLIWQLVLLQEEVYDTLTASTTRDGLRIARVERPDLVILDASTRYAEVVAAASELRRDAETSGIPILVVLGNGRPRADDDLVKVSDDQVVKPLDRSEYVGKIRDLLSRRRRGGGRR